MLAAGQHLGALLLADVDVGQDLLELVVGGLRADHAWRGRAGCPARRFFTRSIGPLHELVVDRLLHERARRAGADLALVEGEHGEALERLVEEVVVLGEDVLEEDVGRLAAQLERDRDEVLGGVLHDEAAGRRLAGEGDLGDALVADASGLPASTPKPLTTLSTPGGSRSPMSSIEHQDAHGRLLGRLEDHAVAGGRAPARASTPP